MKTPTALPRIAEIDTRPTVTLSLSSGEKPVTVTIPVIPGSEVALTLCVNRIEDSINHLWHSRRTTVGEISHRLSEITGAIRMITVLTGLQPCDEGQVVHYLRLAAFRARDAAIARRK